MQFTVELNSFLLNALHHKQPSYLAELLAPRHDTSHNTRSSVSPNFLYVPEINSECGRRSFLYAAPTIWNPYLILFVLPCLFHPFCLGLGVIFFLLSFSLSF